jgi:hypothetical protein
MWRHRHLADRTPSVRLLAAILGVPIFAAGVLAVFVTENGTGAAALLGIGAAFVAFGALGDRLESVDLGGVKLSIRDMARQTFSFARRAEELGDTQAAARLRAVGEELEELADEFRRIRSSMAAGAERNEALDEVVARAAALTGTDDIDPEAVVDWFRLGRPEDRVIAVGLMQGNPRLRDFDAALAAIERDSSPFEIFHGLVLADAMVDTLSRGRREQLQRAVTKVLRGRLGRRAEPIRTQAERITAALDARR